MKFLERWPSRDERPAVVDPASGEWRDISSIVGVLGVADLASTTERVAGALRAGTLPVLDQSERVGAPLIPGKIISIGLNYRDHAEETNARVPSGDILINHAGIGSTGTTADNDDADWARVLSSASRGAVLSLTRAMAIDHLGDGIRLDCVNPGTADTPWVGRLLSAASSPDAERAPLEARQPMGRLVTTQEIARAIAYLTSPLSGSTTGTDLAVDGGIQEVRVP